MLLFFQILLTMFIAEMGDKTQLLMVAMTSRYRLRDIIIGSLLSILALNALAVAFGALISALIPTWLIKFIAGLAFFYFAWSSLGGKEDEEAHNEKQTRHPILAVFATFFLAELGDKTQLTAIAFAANNGLQNALVVWSACSIGLFAADVVGMLAGYLLKEKLPDNLMNKITLCIFALCGFFTVAEGAGLLLDGSALRWAVAGIAAAAFVCLCFLTRKKRT
ncbi:MAG: TMEM165/GDT1 family protein [Oscillospiraceae bacterium]|nr:TMEM165/GDT1 family protein [Oscillospiraceae bacterium]